MLALLKADSLPAIPDLIRVMNEPLDPHVDAVTSPRYNLDPASEAAWSLGRVSFRVSQEAKKVIAALIEVVQSGPASRRGWAAVALGEFKEVVEAVPVLIKLLNEAASDDKFERASSAAAALGKIASETSAADGVIAALLPALDSRFLLSGDRASRHLVNSA